MRSPYPYYAAFFVTGIATLSTSALVALNKSALADEDIGRLLATQFAGQLIGSYFVNRQLARRLCIGSILTASAMTAQVVLAHLSAPFLFVMGLGLGLSMASINTLVGLESPVSLRVRRMELLNVFWPLGAALGPWLVARSAPEHALSRYFSVLAVLFLVLAAISRRSRTTGAEESRQATTQETPLPLAISLFALLAVGVESRLGNWLPTFQSKYFLDFRSTLPLATLFWGGVLFSRTVSSRVFERYGGRFLLLVSP